MVTNLPFISCKTITYGRVDMLEEALYSFLQQDYLGKKEMIIVNDCPFQTLHFDHPEVKIYNLKETFTTIGEKENYAIERCNGDLIAVWDDDDVAMPWHLTNVANVWKENTNIIHWETGVFYNNNNITSIQGIGNSGIVYTKKVWEEIGKSPIENAGGDMTLVTRIHSLGREHVIDVKLPKEKASWFYMWGGRGYHQSGQGTDVPGRPNIIERHSAFVEALRVQGKVPEGDIILNPQWKLNYKKQLEDYVTKN